MATHCNVIDSKSAKSLDSEGTKTLPLGTLAHHHQDIFNCRSFYLWLSTFARSPYLWLSTSFSPSLSPLHALSLARSLPRLLSPLLALSLAFSIAFSLSFSCLLSFALSLSLACSRALSLSLALFFFVFLVRALSFSLAPACAHLHAHLHALSLSRSLHLSLSHTHTRHEEEKIFESAAHWKLSRHKPHTMQYYNTDSPLQQQIASSFDYCSTTLDLPVGTELRHDSLARDFLAPSPRTFAPGGEFKALSGAEVEHATNMHGDRGVAQDAATAAATVTSTAAATATTAASSCKHSQESTLNLIIDNPIEVECSI